MKHPFSIFTITAGLLLVNQPPAIGNSQSQPQLPNFIVILGEGHGWSSTSVQMDDTMAESKSTDVRTPNFEKLAQGGMRFANFYAASPRCTPTRAALFTGKSPAQLRMTFVGEGKGETGGGTNGKLLPPPSSIELPVHETTIAKWLEQAGYASAHFGKWHVGRTDPSHYGFDESDGPTSNGGPDNVDNPHPKELYGMTERGMDFMTRQAKAGRPFYLQLSHYAARQGGAAKPETIDAVKRWGGNMGEQELNEAAAYLDLDLAFGMILDKLDELGIAGNTYVLFTTDHGTPGKNTPLAGGKGTVSEGGLRVPFIIRGPSVQAGSVSHVRTFDVDLFPTLSELAHISAPLPNGIEGGSFASVLTHNGQGTVKRAREEYVVYFPHYDKDSRGPAAALFLGDDKLIVAYETQAMELYDLRTDPRERNNLAAQMPEKVATLKQRLDQYLTEVGQQLPAPNPAYDPAKPTVGKKGGRKENDAQGKRKKP